MTKRLTTYSHSPLVQPLRRLMLGVAAWCYLHAGLAQNFVTLPEQYFAFAGSSLPVYEAQLHPGHTLPGEIYSVVAEYPELQPVSQREARLLRQQPHPQREGQPAMTMAQGLMRGEAVVDVAFSPYVWKNGRWWRMKSFKLRTVSNRSPRNAAQTTAMRALQAAQQTERYAAHSVLASGRWVKIRVQDEGIYRLSNATLKRWGFSDPARVRLYGYGGRLLPEQFFFTGNDALIDDLCEVPLMRQGDNALFFAEGTLRWDAQGQHTRNTFSHYSYYFLTEGEAPAAMPQAATASGASQTVTTVPQQALIDRDETVWYGGGRDFYASDDLQGSGYTYKLPMAGAVADVVPTLDWDVSASSALSSVKVSLKAGSEDVSTVTISQLGENESAGGIRQNGLSLPMYQGKSEAAFTLSANGSARLNYLRLHFTQTLSTRYTTGSFTPGLKGSAQLRIADADAYTRLWQLGGAQQPVAEVPATLNGSTLVADVADAAARFVLVNLQGNYNEPELVGEVQNQDLHATGPTDYVIIVPASGKLTEQAERLAQAHREASGMRVLVVRADEVFNEFSSGTPDATAYRRFMKMLYDRAATDADRPRYLLLMGNCAWDNRMVTSDWRGANPDDYLLAYERNEHENYVGMRYSIGSLRSYVTDDYYGLLDDGEGISITTEKMDLGIGRLLCGTPDEAAWLVDVAIDYLHNNHTGAWKNTMYSVADVGDENLHIKDAQEVQNQVAASAPDAFMVHPLYLDAYDMQQTAQGNTYPAATQKLKTYMGQGALIFNYNGHGSPDRLSHRFLINKEEMAANRSQARPVWIFASCEITPYDQPVSDLGRNALYSTSGPAAAVICAARTVYASYNRAINKGFVKYAFASDAAGKPYTLGDALRLAKCELVGSTSQSSIGTDKTINKLKYALLGDPALTLRYPRKGIVVDSINGMPLQAGDFHYIKSGSVLRFSGYVQQEGAPGQPDASFNGQLTGTLFDAPHTVTCKGAGNTYADPVTYSDYSRSMFQGSVAVQQGRFTLECIVPQGVTLSGAKGLLSLYAVSDDATREYSGSDSRFCFWGITQPEEPDTLGPKVYVYLNTPDFVDGGITNTTPTFYASVEDDYGISMLSGSLGHDMELTLDGDNENTLLLNDYFTFESGSYRKGLVAYPLQELTEGKHTLNFRTWDVYDNPGTARLQFTVRAQGAPRFDVTVSQQAPRTSTRFITTFAAAEGQATQVTTEVFAAQGMRVWSATRTVIDATQVGIDWNLCDYGGNRLHKGVYFYRSRVNGKETDTHKLLIP